MKPVLWVTVAQSELYCLGCARCYDYDKPEETNKVSVFQANTVDEALSAVAKDVDNFITDDAHIYCYGCMALTINYHFPKGDIIAVEAKGKRYVDNLTKIQDVLIREQFREMFHLQSQLVISQLD